MDFTKDIYINKDEIYEDEDFVVLYKGYLFLNNLTKDLYLAYGYGKNWDNKSEIKMKHIRIFSNCKCRIYWYIRILFS